MKHSLGVIILASILCPVFSGAQYSGPVDEFQHSQYVVLQKEIVNRQQQFDQIQTIKSQVDSIISEITNRPVTDYRQEAEKYQQLEVLVPAATKYAQELAASHRELDRLLSQKETLRQSVVSREGSLPVWWTG